MIEILSPSTASRDRRDKKAIYERNGVGEYWLIDPRSRQLTVFLLGAYGRFADGAVLGAGEIHRCRVLPGLRVAVGSLFP